MEATSVYIYRDARGILLYVGITRQGPGRQNQHDASAEWWRYVKSQEVEHYDTRDDAKSRETWLIKNDRPIFNRQENLGWEPRRSAYFTLFDPSRTAKWCNPAAACEVGGSPCAWPMGVDDQDVYCGNPECATCHSNYHGWDRGYAEAHSEDDHSPCGDHDDCVRVYTGAQGYCPTKCTTCHAMWHAYQDGHEEGERYGGESLSGDLHGLAFGYWAQLFGPFVAMHAKALIADASMLVSAMEDVAPEKSLIQAKDMRDRLLNRGGIDPTYCDLPGFSKDAFNRALDEASTEDRR